MTAGAFLRARSPIMALVEYRMALPNRVRFKATDIFDTPGRRQAPRGDRWGPVREPAARSRASGSCRGTRGYLQPFIN